MAFTPLSAYAAADDNLYLDRLSSAQQVRSLFPPKPSRKASLGGRALSYSTASFKVSGTRVTDMLRPEGGTKWNIPAGITYSADLSGRVNSEWHVYVDDGVHPPESRSVGSASFLEGYQIPGYFLRDPASLIRRELKRYKRFQTRIIGLKARFERRSVELERLFYQHTDELIRRCEEKYERSLLRRPPKTREEAEKRRDAFVAYRQALQDRLFIPKKFIPPTYRPRWYDIVNRRFLVKCGKARCPTVQTPCYHMKFRSGHYVLRIRSDATHFYFVWDANKTDLEPRSTASSEVKCSYSCSFGIHLGMHEEITSCSGDVPYVPWNWWPEVSISRGEKGSMPLSLDELRLAVEKMRIRIPQLANLPETLAELGDLKSLLTNIKQINALMGQLPVSVAKTLRQLLNGSNLSVRRTLTSFWHGLLTDVKVLASADLARKFALEPTLKDLSILIKAVLGKLDPLERAMRRLLQIRGKTRTFHCKIDDHVEEFDEEAWVEPLMLSGTCKNQTFGSEASTYWTTLNGDYNSVLSFPNGGWGSYFPETPILRVHTVRRVTRRVTGIGEVFVQTLFGKEKTDDEVAEDALLDSLGLYFQPKLLWDLLPLTFIVDWVINIGGLLDKLTTVKNIRPQLRLAELVVTEKVTETKYLVVQGGSQTYDTSRIDTVFNPVYDPYPVHGRIGTQASAHWTVVGKPMVRRWFKRWLVDPSVIPSDGILHHLKPGPSRWYKFITCWEMLAH